MSTINANFVSDTGPAALIKTADDTGTLVIQTNGVDAVTIGTDQSSDIFTGTGKYCYITCSTYAYGNIAARTYNRDITGSIVDIRD